MDLTQGRRDARRPFGVHGNGAASIQFTIASAGAENAQWVEQLRSVPLQGFPGCCVEPRCLVLWLAQTGAAQAEAAIVAALRKDADDHVREQAIFALTQLPGERGTRALIALAEDRSLTSEQRKRAIFWLAQSNSAEAQAYLAKVLTLNIAD